MALFDPSMFQSSNYNGGMSGGLLGYLAQAMRQRAGVPDEQQSQDPYAQGGSAFGAQPVIGGAGNMPVPTFGQPQPQPQASLPPMAQPTQFQPPQQQSPLMPPQENASGFDRMQAGMANFRPKENGLFPGLMQAMQGFSTGQRTDPQGMQQAQLTATYQALRQKMQAQGMPPQEADATARALALNPELLKASGPAFMDTKPTFGVIGQNQLGVNQYGFIQPNQKTVTPATTASGGSPVGAQGGIDPSLTGPEFLDAVRKDPQLGPGKAEMVKAIAEGRQPYPSGFLLKTPFGQWLTTAVGQYEPGLDATLIGQRSTFNKQMGSSSPTSVGGQKNLMGTALGHLAEVSDAAQSLGNNSGPLPNWLPGSELAAQGTNAVINSSVSQAGKVKALDDAVQKFSGEVGKLYSGSAGGGIAEREATRSRFTGSLPPSVMAASLEMSKALIQSKLAALENQQDQIFGPNNKNRVDFLGANGRAALAKIDETIAKLRGGGSAATAQPQTLPSGWTVKQR
jgi:hypothetical protein